MDPKQPPYPLYWAFLPIFFFGIHFLELYQRGEGIHILWVCHLSNLLLAVGLFLRNGHLVGISVISLLLGLPLWIFDISQTGELLPTSLFPHIGGLLLGLVVLWKLGYQKRTWIYGFCWGILVQQVTRLITPYKENINLAHKIWNGFESSFGSYFEYWALSSLFFLILLFVFELIFLKIYP